MKKIQMLMYCSVLKTHDLEIKIVIQIASLYLVIKTWEQSQWNETFWYKRVKNCRAKMIKKVQPEISKYKCESDHNTTCFHRV